MPPNLLLISIDSWRHDAMPGSPHQAPWPQIWPYRLRVPALSRLAAEGTTFHTLIVQAPFTPASHASFFTGLTPPQHGIRAFFDCRLNPDTPTLAERLRDAGYQTGAIIGADALHPRYGLNAGFDSYDVDYATKIGVWRAGMHRRPGQETTARALAWLKTAREPFFLFVHYFDVHLIAPHIAEAQNPRLRFIRRQRFNKRLPRKARRAFGRLDLAYSRYVRAGMPFHVRQLRAVDRGIGRLLDALAARQRFDRTVVGVLSDHGDAFGEHGETGHRQYLYDTTLRVPLILRPLSRPAVPRVDTMVRAIDVAPTLYELLGVAPPAAPVEGTSLGPLLRGEAAEPRRAYAETKMEQSLEDLDTLRSQLVALRTDRWKVIVDLLQDTVSLYDIAADPGEHDDVAAAYPTIAAEMAAEARAQYDSGRLTNAPSADNRGEIEQRLRDLGYFE